MLEFVERRRGFLTSELLVRIAAAWLVISLMLLATSWNGITALGFAGPDDMLRLVQVRDLYAGQSWFDATQYRVDAANGGLALSGSRIVDLPILAVIAISAPILGQPNAEIFALVAIPLLTLAICLLLAGRIAWRMLGTDAATFTCLALALSPPFLGHVSPLRIDGDGWQIVCALLAINGSMARRARPGAIVSGLALALWLTISMDGLPFILAFCALAALRCIRDTAAYDRLAILLSSLFVSTAVLFLMTRGMADLGIYCDRISPVHLAVLGWTATGGALLARLRPQDQAMRFAGFALIAGGAGIIAVAGGTSCSVGNAANLTDGTIWLPGDPHGLPLWQQDLKTVIQTIIPAMLGIYAVQQIRIRNYGWLRLWWADFSWLLIAAFLFAIFDGRAAAVASALAAIPLGWLIAGWLTKFRRMRKPARRMALMAGMCAALMPALPLTLFTMAVPTNAASKTEPDIAARCSITTATDTLAGMPVGEVAAPLELAPALLMSSDHAVVATADRRAGDSMRFMAELFAASPERARAMLTKRGSEYLALCPDLAEIAFYRRQAPDGLAAQLSEGKQFDWLRPIPTGSGTSLTLWRIAPVGG